MRNATLLFLIKKKGDKITDICLAMKKRGFGAGRYNGAGGKVNEGETIEEAVKRETKEEINVDVKKIQKCAEIVFTFPHNENWDQVVHAYFATKWEGEPIESEEMNPKWFNVNEIPYKEMWPADVFWIPNVLEGKRLKANIVFGEKDTVLEQKITIL